MVSGKSGVRKLGAAVYLESLASLPVEKFVSDFRRRWPDTLFEPNGEEATVTRFKIGLSHIAIEAGRTCVPDSVTNSILEATLQWPTAKQDISTHKDHFAVAATTDDGDTVFLASDLTRAITTLLEITNSLCVCWLNGPVLTSRKDFVWIASKLLRVGQPPFLLWVGVNWRPDGCLVHTKGMAQFGAPDIFLGQQSKLSEEAVSYLHQLVRHVLTPGNTLIEGQTIDGPNCIFRVKSLEGRANNKTGLLLWPVQPNSRVAG